MAQVTACRRQGREMLQNQGINKRRDVKVMEQSNNLVMDGERPIWLHEEEKLAHTGGAEVHVNCRSTQPPQAAVPGSSRTEWK